MKRMVSIWLIMLLLSASCALAQDAPGSWLSAVLGDELARELKENAVTAGGQTQATDSYVALMYIEGEILHSSYQYDHIGTLNAVADLIEDEKNAALLLYLNTPGGSLFEADELYHQLMTYKAKTGRPVYAYMAQECCSAGVYIAMAADRIAASRMTITGSVGVYMSTASHAGLLEKLGIENEYIASGKNKVPGYPELTDEQRAIYQSVVDEGFAYFREALALARKLSDEQMQGFLDGRLLTAAQAKAAGLIDDVLYYDEFEEKIESLHHQAPIRDKTPQDGFSAGGAQMLKWLLEQMPGGKSGAQKQLCPGGLMS